MVMSIIHWTLDNEMKIMWNLVLSGLALKVLVCSGMHWFRFIIFIQGLIYNTWM